MSRAIEYAQKKFTDRDALAIYFPTMRKNSQCQGCDIVTHTTWAGLCEKCFAEVEKWWRKRK